MSVNQNDPRPPYMQIADDLRDRIQARQYEPGQRLPSGRDLAKHYGVSPMTAQNAMKVLSAEGLVVPHGTRGVFVSDPSRPNSDAAPEHSEQYMVITRHLDDIQTGLEELDKRVARLEKLVQQNPPPPTQLRRDDSTPS